MLIAIATLAVLCVVFGLWAVPGPLRLFVFPCLAYPVLFQGVWSPSLAMGLVLIALGLGYLIFWLGTLAKTRETEIFIGGETVKDHPEMRVSGTEFYHTIQGLGGLKTIYRWAQIKYFDPYDLGRRGVAAITRPLQILHNGVLPTYLTWCLLGACVLFYVFMR
jgi:hypothetical protein